MRQITLLVLVVGAALAAPQPAADASADASAADLAAPCNDDGLAHIPDLPEGVRRPYSVRKRSRTVHRDQVAVTDDTPQLPPGQRRFDAVLPDEQGHDPAPRTPGQGRRARGQRSQRLSLSGDQDAANEVSGATPAEPEQQETDSPARRPARRPVARPKKVVVVEENYPVNHPAFAEHDAKADAVVDSYETVRRYPTHLPAEDGDDENLTSNDVLGAPAADQVALEDVPTASIEQREADNSIPAPAGDSDPELPPGYRSKFPKRTFASDAGGSGDVLRLKPRKRVNQYQAPPAPATEEEEAPRQAEVSHEQRQEQVAPRPRPRPQAAPRHDEQPAGEAEAAAVHTGPGAAVRGRHRESQRVQADQGAEPVQRRQPLRRRPADPVSDDPDAEQPAQTRRPQPQRRRPLPRPRPTTPADEDQVQQEQEQAQQEQSTRSPARRRPRPRPVLQQQEQDEIQVQQEREQVQQEREQVQQEQGTPAPARRRPRPRPVLQQQEQDEVQVAPQAPSEDGGVRENTVTPASPAAAGAEEPQPQPRRRPLRRRPRPRPRPVAAEEDVGQGLDNVVQTTAASPVRRRRPQAAGSRTVNEESFQVQAQQPEQEQGSRGHGRRLDSASSLQGLPQVQVEHDGTAKEGHHEPTLVRSAVKKLPEGSHPGDPSPALIQKIVKNTLRRLKPQIAEHEGDVKVDILVKVIQVEDRK